MEGMNSRSSINKPVNEDKDASSFGALTRKQRSRRSSDVDNDQKFQHLGRPKSSPSRESESSLKTEEAEWLTSKEAADYLRISEGTLRNMASNGRIPYAKLGRSNRYSRSQLNQLLLSNKRGALNGY